MSEDTPKHDAGTTETAPTNIVHTFRIHMLPTDNIDCDWIVRVEDMDRNPIAHGFLRRQDIADMLSSRTVEARPLEHMR